jgi:hypothetical protein
MALGERVARDPFIRQFFERIPGETRGTFTSRQLAALKMVFGESTRAGHMVDIRLEVPLTPRNKKRLYMVALFGQDHRGGKRVGKRGFWRYLFRLVGRLIVALIILSFLLAILFLLM